MRNSWNPKFFQKKKKKKKNARAKNFDREKILKAENLQNPRSQIPSKNILGPKIRQKKILKAGRSKPSGKNSTSKNPGIQNSSKKIL